MRRLRIWLEATRPKTLPAAVCPVAIGSAIAYSDSRFMVLPALLCLLFAALVQIGTNFANDYLDGVKGSDTGRRLGPRRAVASGQVEPASMKRAAIALLAAAFCLGLGLIPFGGWALLGVGVASVTCAWLYTGGPYPLAYNGLGDVFVVLFFGFVAVGFTYFVQATSIRADVLLAGLACGLLINNILVINNYRDCEEDRVSGKQTLIARFGRGFGRLQYLVSTVVTAGITVYFAGFSFGTEVLLALIPLAFSLGLFFQLKQIRGAEAYLLALQRSGQVVAAYGLILSAAIVL